MPRWPYSWAAFRLFAGLWSCPSCLPLLALALLLRRSLCWWLALWAPQRCLLRERPLALFSLVSFLRSAMSASRGDAQRALAGQLSALTAQEDAVQDAILATLGPGAALSASVASTPMVSSPASSSRAPSVAARSESRSSAPRPKKAQRRVSQPRGSVALGNGMGVTGGLAAKSSPTAPTSLSCLLASSEPSQLAAMGPPPAAVRGPGSSGSQLT